MITDKRFEPTDRSNEVWIEVDAPRAMRAYRDGGAEIVEKFGLIEKAALDVYGDEIHQTPFPKAYLRRDMHVKEAKRILHQCIRMSRILSAGVGTARMPSSEVRAWLDLEDGTTIRRLLNPEAAK